MGELETPLSPDARTLHIAADLIDKLFGDDVGRGWDREEQWRPPAADVRVSAGDCGGEA